MNIAISSFKFSGKIFKNDNLDKLPDYTPTIQTDYDSEIRIDCNKAEFVLENKIFHKNVRINIKASSKIKIKNCVFMHSLSLYPETEHAIKNMSLHCYKILVKQNLVLVRDAAFSKVSIDSCAMAEFIVTDSLLDEIEFYNTEVSNDIYLEGTHIGEFVIHKCYINIIKNYFLEVNEVDIDIASFEGYHKDVLAIKPKNFIDHSELNKAKSEIRNYKTVLHNKSMPYGKTKKEIKAIAKQNTKIFRESIADRKKNATKNFLNFILLIKKSTHESIDAQILAELNYRYYRNKQYNPFIFIGLWMLGFFFKPSRLIITTIVAIFSFGILYYLAAHTGDSLMTFNQLMSESSVKNIILDLNKFIYFSVITFYTIGYSDLPDSIKMHDGAVFIKQYLVFFEAIIGVFINSSIIISLMNRHGIKN
jgi:hypothetical protein